MRLGNELVRRSIALIEIAVALNIEICLEHPRTSKLWQLPEIHDLIRKHGLQFAYNDWCEYSDDTLPNKKPTAILTNAPWCLALQKRCRGSHTHGPPLRGRALKAAAAYPQGYCRELAASFVAHMSEKDLR